MTTKHERPTAGARPGTGQASAATARRVLLVDDQSAFLEIGRHLLRTQGYEVMTATSGGEALRVVRATRPDVIVLDVTMPDLDGLETCRRLKTNPATSAIPVVLLTGTGDPKLNEKASAAGAAAIVLKGMDTERLLNVLRLLLNSAKGRPKSAAGPRA